MPLPKHFCWTRFGTEAGEGIERILARKEEERLLNAGVFLWGIGNAVGPSMRQLVKVEADPEVVFSPIRSAPRKVDVHPERVAVWTAGQTIDGQPYELPANSLVISRFNPSGARKRHYALVCASQVTLGIDPRAESVFFGELRNLLTNRPVGTTQVTAIVSRVDRNNDQSGRLYPAAIRAQLVYPYLLQLVDPVPLADDLCRAMAEKRGQGFSLTDLVRRYRNEGRKRRNRPSNLNLI